jgi:Site-specific recombinase XerD
MTLTDKEVDALRAQPNLNTATGVRNRAILETMLGAGLRVSEVVNLLPADVDLEEGTIRVNLGKGAKDRVIPIDETTALYLRAWTEKKKALGYNGRRYFFCGLKSKGKRLTRRSVEYMVERLGRLAGIQRGGGKHSRYSPHILRHTYATRLLDDPRFNVREVQELLGHANLTTTQVYTHVNPRLLREKIQQPKVPAPEQAEAGSVFSPQQRKALTEVVAQVVAELLGQKAEEVAA